MEITYALSHHPDAFVSRSGRGREQVTPVRNGTIWLCPPEVLEDSTRISQDLSNILHVTLPASLFGNLREELHPNIRANSVRYEAGVEDSLLERMLMVLAGELANETSSGELLVESMSLAIGTHLASRWMESQAEAVRARADGPILDWRRLKRVIDYVEEHLETGLSVADLARVACLSRFHFARAFKAATGRTPHEFVGHRRLERAKTLLQAGRCPIAEISLRCSFSSQASFTKAFSRAVGTSPGQYRRRTAGR